ncbi:MAG: polysaccharide pyruvyl transferase family protein [Armatimonadota bacterium]
MKSSKQRNILMVGNGSFANRGCEAIVRGTVDILSRHMPDATFTLGSLANPNVLLDAKRENDTRVEHKPAIRRSLPRNTPLWWLYKVLLRPFPAASYHYLYPTEYRLAQKSNVVLQIGGDNYTLDYGSPVWRIHMDTVLSRSGAPLVLWGASIGPFSTDPQTEELMAAHLRLFRLICARETETLSYLQSIGVSDNVKLVADPAFHLRPQQPSLSSELMSLLDQQPMGLNLSPLVGEYRSDASEWRRTSEQCIRALVDSGIGPVLLIPHVTETKSNDYDFMVQLMKDLQYEQGRLDILPGTLTAAEYKWVISKLRVFIGARTHSTIAAISSCVPTISIGYSLKSVGINKDIFGHLQWLIPIGDLTPTSLVDRVQDLIQHASDVRGHLHGVLPEFQSRADMAGHYIREIISC